MEIVNLTPHDVYLAGADVTLPSRGIPPRVSLETTKMDDLDVAGHPATVEIVVERPGEVTDLPPAQAGIIYIVSRMVAEACTDRHDLCYPTALIRDDQGRIVGCGALGIR